MLDPISKAQVLLDTLLVSIDPVSEPTSPPKLDAQIEQKKKHRKLKRWKIIKAKILNIELKSGEEGPWEFRPSYFPCLNRKVYIPKGISSLVAYLPQERNLVSSDIFQHMRRSPFKDSSKLKVEQFLGGYIICCESLKDTDVAQGNKRF